MLSHYTAVEFHEACDRPADLHLTRPTSRHASGYTVHVERQCPDDMCWIDGLSVTTLERTTYDLGYYPEKVGRLDPPAMREKPSGRH